VPADHGGADRAGDVVVAGSDVCDERAERVERSFVAKLVFLFHLQLDLVERDVAGAFDHRLHVVFPGFFGEFTEDFEFGELRFVTGVGETTGAETITEREADVVLLKNFADGVEILVEEILLFVSAHPLRKKCAAAADDSGDAVADEREKFAEDAGVDGHVVDALLGLLFDHFEHDVDIQILGAADAGDRFVDRHGADGNRGRVNDGFADAGDIAAGGEVHHGVRTVVDGAMELFEFVADIGSGGGVSDVGVDFAEEGDADAHRFEIAVMDISGDDGAAARDFAADEFGLELFAAGDVFHFLGDDAVARVMHLREVSCATICGNSPFFNPSISHRHSIPPFAIQLIQG